MQEQTPTPAADAAGVVASADATGVAARRGSRIERRAAEAACVGVMVIWAGNFIVVKSTIPILSPIGYAFLRFAIAGLVLLALCRWREGSVTVPRADIVPLAGLGLLGFGIYQVLWSTALFSTSATSLRTSSKVKPVSASGERSACFCGRVGGIRGGLLSRGLGAYTVTRVRYSPVRVSMRRVSPSLMKSGTLTT